MILAANLPYELFNRNTSYLRICTLLKYVKQTNIKKKKRSKDDQRQVRCSLWPWLAAILKFWVETKGFLLISVWRRYLQNVIIVSLTEVFSWKNDINLLHYDVMWFA